MPQVFQESREKLVTRAFKENADPVVLREIKENRVFQVMSDRQETQGDLERTDQKVPLVIQDLWDYQEKREIKAQGVCLV